MFGFSQYENTLMGYGFWLHLVIAALAAPTCPEPPEGESRYLALEAMEGAVLRGLAYLVAKVSSDYPRRSADFRIMNAAGRLVEELPGAQFPYGSFGISLRRTS